MRMMLAACAALLLLTCAIAGADTIVLNDGTVIEGKVVGRDGDRLIVEIAVGRLKATQRIPSANIARIEQGQTENDKVLDEAARRKAALRDNGAQGWFDYGQWLTAQTGLSKDAQDAFRRAVQIDPEHAGARRALGFMKDENGRWRPEEEVMRERGFVRFEGGWMTPAERDAEVARREEEKRLELAMERMRLEEELEVRYGLPPRDRDSLAARLGFYPPGYYYRGEPVISGTYMQTPGGGSAFYGVVGPGGVGLSYCRPPGAGPCRPASPGIAVEGGDTSFYFGSNRGGWNWRLNFSGSRGDTSWSGSVGGGGD